MSKQRAAFEGSHTQPSEIPTAIIEPDPFLDDSQTVIDDATLESTPTTGTPSLANSPALEKFRRPTRSEIVDAVDQVNTEAVELEALARAQRELGDGSDRE